MFKLLVFTFFLYTSASAQSPLQGKRVCIDPGHGGTAATDQYRVGRNGEREEWINLRVAMLLRDLLHKKGAIVFMTRESDTTVDLANRAKLARENAVDIFISIHHNATADRKVNFPIIYYHGAASENVAGVQLAQCVAGAFLKEMYKKNTPVSIASDFTIFPDKGAGVLRESYGIPALLCEASFFTNEAEERKLKTQKHNLKEARAYLQAIECYFSQPPSPIHEKQIPLKLPKFTVLQESERMQPEALLWLSDYEEARELMKKNDTVSLRKAYELFTRSARSFPDSWVARECHKSRAAILMKLREPEHANEELIRAIEFFVPYLGTGSKRQK